MKRQRMNQKSAKRLFTRTAGANHTHARNLMGLPMRGGIRM